MGDPYVYNITIPPAPNWYETSVMTYTPDDTLMYGSKGDLIVVCDVANKSLRELVTVKIMRRIHSQRITSLGINPKWGEKGSLLVTTGEDKYVKVWDMETQELKASHQQHLKSNKIVSAAFAGSDRVVSVSDDGHVILWSFNCNEVIHLSELFNTKVTVTCLSVCPHYPKIAAFGLKNGLILVTDLRGKGKLLYKLRGHDKEVISLDWCPIPFNIFPKNPNNRVFITPEQFRAARKENTDDIVHKLVEEIMVSVSINIEGASVTTSFHGPSRPEVPAEAINSSQENITVSSTVRTEKSESDASSASGSTLTVTTRTTPATSSESAVSETSTELEIQQLDLSESSLTIASQQSVSFQSASSQNTSQASLEVSPVTSDCTGRKGKGRKWKKKQGTQDWTKPGGSSTSGTPTRPRTEMVEDSTKQDQTKPGSTTITILKRPQPDPPKGSTKQDQTKLGSSPITILKRPQSEPPKDSTKQAQEKLKKSLNIDSPRPDPEAAEDSTQDDQHEPDSVSATEDSTTSSPVNVEPGKVTGESDSEVVVKPPSTSSMEKCPKRKLDQSSLALQDLIILPPGATKPYCEVCKSEEDCFCPNAVKMITANIEQARKEYLLVSSAREPTIIVWRVGTGGTTQALLRLPTKKQKKGRPSDRPWITVKWPVPNKIYCSSRGNELIQWTVPKPARGEGESMKVIHDDHSALIFSIATSVEDYVHKNWMIPPEHVIWTTSQDRQLICYRIDSEETEIERLAMYPTFAGVPECLAGNKLNPYRVAIGTGGGILKIWDMTHTTDKIVTMQHLTQKIHSKVTCAAWHPNNENIIAFGTQEGRVGIFDVTERSGVPTLMPHFFTKEIYKMQWAPIKDDVFGLYLIAEGKLVYWNIETPEIDPVVVEIPEGQFAYNFGWKLDYSCLLISLKSGLLLTYSAELREIDSLMCAQKFSLLSWNPLSYTNDTSMQTFCLMYAAVLNRKTMIVMDHGKQTHNFEEKLAGKYDAHKDQINTITWNNYGTRVAIGTEDGFIFIWDLPTKTVIWSYVHETFQGITSVIFSPLGTEHIFCGTRDCTLKVFRQKDHPALDAATLSVKRSLIAVLREEESRKTRDDTLRRVGGSEDKSQKEKQKKSNELLPVFHRSRTSPPDFLADLKRLLAYVTEGVLERDERNDVDILDIFGAQDTMLQLVARNELIMRERGRGLDVPLAMFRSDSARFLFEAVRSRRVTPAIIALAPFVSQRLWLEAIEVYADILSEDPHSDPIEAATYYLASHRVREAIDVLVARNMFKEALALAKCRCPPDSAVVTQVIEAWGKYALENGNFERAAECYIYLGKFAEAATALFKRTEPQILLFAVELADKVDNDPLFRATLYRYQTFLDHGEHTKQSLKTDTIADVLMNVRKNDGDGAKPSTSSAGPSSAVAGSAVPSSSVAGSAVPSSVERTGWPGMTDDDAMPPPSFLAHVQPVVLDDDFAESASVSSLISYSSDTFLTRGHHDPSTNIIPAEEDPGIEGAAIIAAIQSRVIQEADEALMESDESSSRDLAATPSTTSMPSSHPEARPSHPETRPSEPEIRRDPQ